MTTASGLQSLELGTWESVHECVCEHVGGCVGVGAGVQVNVRAGECE